MPFLCVLLFCAEYSVAGIAQAGDNVTVFIEVIIQCGDIYICIRMLFLYPLNAFRRSYDGHELYVSAATFFNKIDCCAGTAACCQHGVNDDDIAFGNVVGQLAIVFDRLKRVRVTV